MVPDCQRMVGAMGTADYTNQIDHSLSERTHGQDLSVCRTAASSPTRYVSDMDLEQTLHRHFGFSEFRPGQRAVVLVPAGTWLTGAFNLSSHTELRLARGATIEAVTSVDREQFPALAPFPSYGWCKTHEPLLASSRCCVLPQLFSGD